MWKAAFTVFLAFLGQPAAAAGSFIIQWQDATPSTPWLSRCEIRAFSEALKLETAPIPSEPEFPHGLRVTLRNTGDEPGWIQVRLGSGFGFTISEQMLDRSPYLWVRDMGIYISRLGTWRQTAGQREATAAAIKQSLARPFVSCAEKYFSWTGFAEHEPKLDQKIWDFVREKQSWPVEARSAEHIAAMPEVDASYFTRRFPDLKYSRMYLGWPDHNDEFILWSHGKIGVSSHSVGGDPKRFPDSPWQPRASGYTVQFGVGDSPRFREYGDEAVRQRLLNGYDLVGVTEWSDDGLNVTQTNFAYPLDGEQVRSGVEPLLAWTRLEVSNAGDSPRDTYLGIEFTNEDFGGSQPLPGLKDLVFRNGGFYILGNLFAVAGPALQFEEMPATGNRRRFRAPVRVDASASAAFTFANFYRGASPSRIGDVRNLGFPAALERTLAYWRRLQEQGASITVPDPLLNNLYRTLLPRITINSDLDLNGYSVLQTGPVVYNRVWHHVTAYAVADYLARRGYFDLAKRYLEPYFHWQGIPAPDSPAVKDWSGFFGAPPEQCPLVWLMYQGMIQWASARYYQLSHDRAWLDQKLPALLKSMEWVAKIRASTKNLNPDGSKPLNYGWFPPGRVTDGSHGTSVFSDANIWRGMEYMTQVLESTGHARAAGFRRETDDYREAIQDGMRRAAAERPLVRLNDDTWVPYLPAYLEKVPGQMESTTWYAAVVDGPWQGGLLDTHVFPLGAPENEWLVNFFEDTYSPMNPSLPDEPQWACHATDYLHRDRVNHFLYVLYSQSTTTMARRTLTTYEHRSWGKDRVFELTGWAAGYWNRNFTDMLARTVGSELWLNQATPRRWLAGGQKIEVRGLQTEFGPLTFTVESHLASGNVEARITAPSRAPATKIRIRFRVPGHRPIRAVLVNGQPWQDFDAAGEWVTLPAAAPQATVVVRY